MAEHKSRAVDVGSPGNEQASAEGQGIPWVADGWWDCDGEKVTHSMPARFDLRFAQTVRVETSVKAGPLDGILVLKRQGAAAIPYLPHEGGSYELKPGFWYLQFYGMSSSLSKPCSMRLRVHYVRSPYLRSPLGEGDGAEVVAKLQWVSESIFELRTQGKDRHQAVDLAYQEAEKIASGKPYGVLDQRVSEENSDWTCILTCQFI